MRRCGLYSVIGFVLLTACGGGSSSSSVSVASIGRGAPVAASSRDVDIESPVINAATQAATTIIRATVYTPAHNEGDTYPLILNSHGWGGSRYSQSDVDNNDPGDASDSSRNFFDLVDSQVEALWAAGFAVISYDERGFGRNDDGDNGSDDGAHGMSPDYEIEDAKAVVDWALANLDLTLDAPGDPRMGALGGSYGGAFQLMLAGEDPRIDALVPGATWFDFGQALLPNGVIKKAYGLGLCARAQSDMAQLSTEVARACTEGAFTSVTREQLDASQEAQNVFILNSLKTMSEGAGFVMPDVDVLWLQGNRDILFNLNQGVLGFEFLQQGGGDVRLLSHEGGHGIRALRAGAGAQGELGLSFCGPIDTITTLTAWLSEKLKGGAATSLPRVCLSLDDNQAVYLDAVPRGTQAFRVPIAATSLSGADHHNDNHPTSAATFIPLGTVATEPQVLAGVPIANLVVSADAGNADPTPATGPAAGVFIGIGIQRNGGDLILVDDQVQPFISTDPRVSSAQAPVNLIGVAEDLHAGDQVGLLLYARHDQYENHAAQPAGQPNTGTAWSGNRVTVSGSVDLPIIEASPETRSP